MPQQITVSYQKGDDAYEVVLTGEALKGVFKNASGHPSLAGKEGEERVRAILALGGISSVERYKNGLRNDGPGGEPGIQDFMSNGNLLRSVRYRDDRINNSADGQPAILKFNENGTLLAVRYIVDDELNDGPKGEIAVLQFNHTGDTLVYAARFDDGKRVHKLTDDERLVCSAQLLEKASVQPADQGNTVRRPRTAVPVPAMR